MIVDGGDKAAGQKLVDHVRSVYGTTVVEHVLNTHPDADHSSGLSVVLEQLNVRNLWLHRPWEYAANILDRFKNPRLTASGLEDRVRAALAAAHDLEAIANAKRIPMREPYQGTTIGPFLVLAPSKDWYLRDLVPNFARTPAAKEQPRGILEVLSQRVQEGVSWVAERLDLETLDESGETSAQNESSVVIYGQFDGKGVLFTGDAGRQSLAQAITFARALGISLRGLNCVQIPHHGSRRNVSPSILNEITASYALISVAPKSSTHPRRKVTNAFRRRGARVYKTNGGLLNHTIGWTRRDGLSDAEEVPFFENVEA